MSASTSILSPRRRLDLAARSLREAAAILESILQTKGDERDTLADVIAGYRTRAADLEALATELALAPLSASFAAWCKGSEAANAHCQPYSGPCSGVGSGEEGREK